MNGPHLTPVERAVYDAGQAEARATHWRVVADLEDRDGKPSAISRQYQAEYEAEAADAWRRLATLKGEDHAQAAE